MGKCPLADHRRGRKSRLFGGLPGGPRSTHDVEMYIFQYIGDKSGGRGRTRTYEGIASGFTVRPLCRSGHSPSWRWLLTARRSSFRRFNKRPPERGGELIVSKDASVNAWERSMARRGGSVYGKAGILENWANMAKWKNDAGAGAKGGKRPQSAPPARRDQRPAALPAAQRRNDP